MNIKKVAPNSILYKSNALINSLYDLTLQEQRIILILISMVNPKEDKEFRNFEMSVEMFKNIIGLDSKGGYYQELEEVVQKLMKRSFKIDRPEGDGWLRVGWLASCEYKKGAGCIELEISAKLHPYLLNLKSRYTSYRLKNILPLRSGYSIRLYELLKQYEAVGERFLGVDEMRLLMEIKETEYKNYNDFKKKVILKAQKELLEKTDICFEFKEKKKVRKIIGIYFFIKKNVPEEDKTIDMITDGSSAIPSKEVNDSLNVELYERLLKLMFSKEQAKILLSKYDKERLAANLEYAEFKIRQGGVENIPAYAQTIIKNDVRLQSNLFDVPTVEQQPAINLENGMVIEIAGKKYIYADDYLSMGKGSGIPKAMLKQMIRNGEAKIVG